MPAPYTSVGGPGSEPAACSGAMYAGVPSTKPACVEYVRVPLSIFAMPKSVIFSRPSSVISALPGLTSRWSTSRSCAYWSAAHMATRGRDGRLEGRGPRVGGERAPAEPLHHEQVQALVLDEVVDGDDVVVAERGQQPGLVEEAAAQLGVLGVAGGQQLDGHLAPELAVRGGQDDAGGAAAELVADLVRRQRRRDLLDL